jgi:hypothetical protein
MRLGINCEQCQRVRKTSKSQGARWPAVQPTMIIIKTTSGASNIHGAACCWLLAGRTKPTVRASVLKCVAIKASCDIHFYGRQFICTLCSSSSGMTILLGTPHNARRNSACQRQGASTHCGIGLNTPDGALSLSLSQPASAGRRRFFC